MVYTSSYQAAHTIAETVHAHFSRHISSARARGGEGLAPVPPAQVIEAVIDVTFWASLQREEGHSPKISIALLPPGQNGQALHFERRFPLTPAHLTKLAPAVERPGIHIGVWQEGEELVIWGATRTIPSLCFVLEVVEPGLLVVKHRRLEAFGKFANVAVLKGEEVKVVDEKSSSLPDCPSLLTALLDFGAPSSWTDPADDDVNVLVQLATSMRAHGRGGSLLVVPARKAAWRESIIHPMAFAVVPPFAGLAHLLRQDERERTKPSWQDSLRRAVDGVAGLTAVDGAAVIDDQYELLAFGAKIGRPEKCLPVEEIMTSEPIVGGGIKVVHPTEMGGTRHLSAAQFVHDQHDALALVASQDGRFTIFAWSPCEGMVHAYRVDSLLL
ncbi:diadenylate cyclase [soil metagenome]